MNEKKLNLIKNGKGFIAALDQSGGSTPKTLNLYGVSETSYKNEEEMFEIVHNMRKRIIENTNFNNSYIIGTILFEKTMNSKINDEYTSDYLWNIKHIISFLKIDKGLKEEESGVQTLKKIENLEEILLKAKERNIFGTKMRSVIKSCNKEGIKKLIEEQFELANEIYSYGLIPIVEPEVDINASDKEECEKVLKEFIDVELKKYKDIKIILKLTLPDIDNFYESYINHPNIIRVVALSGGYERTYATKKLKNNKGVIASFSRALLENLNINQTEQEFSLVLKENIIDIYKSSIEK